MKIRSLEMSVSGKYVDDLRYIAGRLSLAQACDDRKAIMLVRRYRVSLRVLDGPSPTAGKGTLLLKFSRSVA